MSTDPRRYRCCGHCKPGPTPDLCADFMPPAPRDTHDTSCPSGCNAADPLRRALTPGTDEHEAAVEQIARAVWESNAESDDGYGPWDDATPWDKDWGRSSVRAVLAALRGRA
jgi:hypothetical protein